MTDLVSSEARAIRGLIEDKRYWSAAEHVLRHAAGPADSGPAQSLPEKPPLRPDHDRDHEGLRLATAVVAMAIEWIDDAPTVARCISDSLKVHVGRPERAGWEAVRSCFSGIHPRVLALNARWLDWTTRVRDNYARHFGLVPCEVRDEDGRLRMAWMPCDDADPSAAIHEHGVRYETSILEFIDEVDDRTRYEEMELQRLKTTTETGLERRVVDCMIDLCRTRIRKERDAWRKVRESARRQAFNALSADDVWQEMVQIVHDCLPHGVGGRTRAQWQSLLRDALEERIRDIGQESERERASVGHQLGDHAEDNPEYLSAVLSAIAHHEEHELEHALPSLILEELRIDDPDEWNSLADAARRQRVSHVGTSSIIDSRTSFLEVLDGLERMMMASCGVGRTGEAPNLIPTAHVILEELFSELDVHGQVQDGDRNASSAPAGAELVARAMREFGGERGKTSATIAQFADLRINAPSLYSGCLGAAARIIQELSKPEFEGVILFGSDRSRTDEAERN